VLVIGPPARNQHAQQTEWTFPTTNDLNCHFKRLSGLDLAWDKVRFG
jgi:hypothetical protein